VLVYNTWLKQFTSQCGRSAIVSLTAAFY